MDPPLLCAKGCGFYGSVENKNMCSKCFKDYLKEESSQKILQVRKRGARSRSARKGLNLPAFAAAAVVCFAQTKHRYPEEHSCDVDFKKAGRDLLAKQNALCIGDKLQWRLC
ncbi:hypothetical protein M0R45_034695 [Rubus argutus]|uniref:A20-type domain-containing protein n=1 Tax=Rubus argutus TaxID=59490 RepID=A0AAW1VV97_RUBAR